MLLPPSAFVPYRLAGERERLRVQAGRVPQQRRNVSHTWFKCSCSVLALRPRHPQPWLLPEPETGPGAATGPAPGAAPALPVLLIPPQLPSARGPGSGGDAALPTP